MRILTDAEGRVGEVADGRLAELYAAPGSPWLRVNMVSTVDGAATGTSGRSGSINNAADHRVFATLRDLCDAVLVGAGTAAAEGYGPFEKPLVLVSGRGRVPEKLTGHEQGRVLLATCASAPGLAVARAALGQDQVLVHGDDRVDLEALVEDLHGRGLQQVLCEGGPHLLGDLLAASLVDELCATVVPLLGGGDHPRITAGPDVGAPLRLVLLLEQEGTLLARWRLDRQPHPGS